jgi:hypothetical protein
MLYHDQNMDEALTECFEIWRKWVASAENVDHAWEENDLSFLYHFPQLYPEEATKDYQVVFYVNLKRERKLGPNNDGVELVRRMGPLQFESSLSNAATIFYQQLLNEVFIDSLGRVTPENTRLHLKCWDRHNVLVKSNISKNNDYFVGYTRGASNVPIKYYRLTSDSKRFWIELYSSQDYNRLSIFPKDIRTEAYIDTDGEPKTRTVINYLDDLFIEAIFCYSASAMI